MASFDLMSSLFMREFGPPIFDAPGDAESFDERGYELFGSHQEHARMLETFLRPLAETPMPSVEHIRAAVEMMLTAAIVPAKLAELDPSYVPTGAQPHERDPLHLIAMPVGHINFVKSIGSINPNDMLPIAGTMADYGFVPKLPPGFTWYVKRSHLEYVGTSERHWSIIFHIVVPGDTAPSEYKARAKAAREAIDGQRFQALDFGSARAFADQWRTQVSRYQWADFYRVHIYSRVDKPNQVGDAHRADFYNILAEQASYKPDSDSKKEHLKLWIEITKLTREFDLFDAEIALSLEEMRGDSTALAQARDIINRTFEVGVTPGIRFGVGVGQVRTLTRQSAGHRLRETGDATIVAWMQSMRAFQADRARPRTHPHPFYDGDVALKLREQIIATREFATVVRGITRSLTALAGEPSLRGILDVYRRRAPDDPSTSRQGVSPSWARFSSRHVWPSARRAIDIATFRWLRFPQISGYFRQASPVCGTPWAMPSTWMLTGTTIAFAALYIWLISLVPPWIVSSAIYPFLHVFTTPAAMFTNVTPAALTDDVVERVRVVVGTFDQQAGMWGHLEYFAMLSSKTKSIRQAGYNVVYRVADKASTAAAALVEKGRAETAAATAAAAVQTATEAVETASFLWKGRAVSAATAAETAADAARNVLNKAAAVASRTLATHLDAERAARLAASPTYTVGDVTNLFRAPFANVTMAGADFGTIQQNIGHSTSFGSWTHMAAPWFGVSSERLEQLFTDSNVVGPEGSFLTDVQMRRTPNPVLDYIDKPWTVASPLGVAMTVGSTMLGLMVIKKNLGSPLTGIGIAAATGIGVYIASWFHTEVGKVLATVGSFIATSLSLQLPTYVTWSAAALFQMMVISSQLYMITAFSKYSAEIGLAGIRMRMRAIGRAPPPLVESPETFGGFERFILRKYHVEMNIPMEILGATPPRK